MTLRNWLAWFNVIAGVWLFFSPWILGYLAITTAVWTFIVLGVLIGVVAFYSQNRSMVLGTGWLLTLLGAFTFITPWLFSFTSTAIRWNAWIIGAFVVIVALWALMSRDQNTTQRALG